MPIKEKLLARLVSARRFLWLGAKYGAGNIEYLKGCSSDMRGRARRSGGAGTCRLHVRHGRS